MLNRFYDKFIFSNTLKFKHNNFFLLNTPFLIIPNAVFAEMLVNASDEFCRIIYSQVKESVKKNLTKSFDLDFGLKKDGLVHFIEDFLTYSGWGRVTTIDLDFEKKRAIVSIENSAFSETRAGKPIDHIMRGILAGFFSKIFGEEIDCVETQCCCTGANSCEFVLKKTEEFDFSKEEARRQLKV